jgi:transcriptional regulator with XRE-family HTH domain/methylase of polypeptide subunit release factors
MDTSGQKRTRQSTPLTTEQKAAVVALRTRLGLSREELAQRAEITEKTLRRIELGEPGRRFDQQTLIRLANALGVPLESLMNGTAAQEDAAGLPLDFDRLERIFRQIDQNLIPVIHDLGVSSRLIEETYDDLLRARVAAHGFSLEQLREHLHTPATLTALANSLAAPDLSVDVADNFGRITFSHDDRELVVDSPTLLWDCPCRSPGKTNPEKSCPIHRQEDGVEIATRFRGGRVTIRSRGLSFRWRNGMELFPPSVDAFAMLEDLLQAGLGNAEIGSLVDVGSGTGFLGIALAHFNPHLTKLVLTDWLLTPLVYGLVNWRLNQTKREYLDAEGRVGLFTLPVADDRFDVAVCNPPYLPLLEGFEEVGWESTVAGTDLLENLIGRSRELADNVYVQFSNLASLEAKAAAKAASVSLEPIGEERVVPLRLPVALERPEYLQILVQERGLQSKRKVGHRYWHRIRTYLVKPG